MFNPWEALTIEKQKATEVLLFVEDVNGRMIATRVPAPPVKTVLSTVPRKSMKREDERPQRAVA